jgi:short-subunit dehydrogenase
MGSIQGRIAPPFSSAYSGSKSAIRTVHRTLRHELRPWGIEVVLLEVGAVGTAIWEKSRSVWREPVDRDPVARSLYGDYCDRFEAFAERAEARAGKVEQVVGVLRRVISSRRPRFCYRVGMDARVLWLLHFFPAALEEALLEAAFGFPARGSRSPLASEPVRDR